MAHYKYEKFVTKVDSAAYDTLSDPGVKAPNAGIYRCNACGHEIGIALGHVLPPQGHHKHPIGIGPIKWQLIVFAVHK